MLRTAGGQIIELWPLLLIGAIFLGIIISSIVQLIILRIAMVFPPVRYLVRSILDEAYKK